jgi:hypothetical protein
VAFVEEASAIDICTSGNDNENFCLACSTQRRGRVWIILVWQVHYASRISLRHCDVDDDMLRSL